MPEGGVKLKNLTGYTTYMISVAPFNAAGDGPRSPPTRGRTQQAGSHTSLPTSVAIPCAGGGILAGRIPRICPNVDDSTAREELAARMMLIGAQPANFKPQISGSIWGISPHPPASRSLASTFQGSWRVPHGKENKVAAAGMSRRKRERRCVSSLSRLLTQRPFVSWKRRRSDSE